MTSWQQIGDVAQTMYERLFRCEHRTTRIVWTKYSNWGYDYQKPQLRNYCDACGRFVGSALKHSLANDDTPWLDREQAERPKRMQIEYSEQLGADRERQAEQWRADYEAYLLSPEWDDKRALVLKRARGVCEGCGEVPATEVHHLTYSHVGNELLWQLVAVCRNCHARVHGIEDDTA
jgi:5-methylcytosine-specific restriction endonuclease McrA